MMNTSKTLGLTDRPGLVVIQVYITSASRAYQIADHYRARGVFVALGGLHVTACPAEAVPHSDVIFLGPGEDTWSPRIPQLAVESKACIQHGKCVGASLENRCFIARFLEQRGT